MKKMIRHGGRKGRESDELGMENKAQEYYQDSGMVSLFCNVGGAELESGERPGKQKGWKSHSSGAKGLDLLRSWGG